MNKKIKLFKLYISREHDENSYDQDSYSEFIKYIPVNQTDWEEVSWEDYSKLRTFVSDFNTRNTNTRDRYLIVEEPETPPSLVVTTIKGIYEAEQKAREAALKKEQERIANLDKEKKAKAQKSLERKKRQFEKLQKELGK